MAQPPLPQQHRQPPPAQTHIHQRHLKKKKKKKPERSARQIKQTHIPNQTSPKVKPTTADRLREVQWWEAPMTWWMARQARRRGVAW